MFTLHHFDSSIQSVVRLGLILCTLILTVKHSSCGRHLKRGNNFFFSLSLCRAKVHCFTLTASTRLHKSKHLKNEKKGEKKVKYGWGKQGQRDWAGWCHPFYSNKEDPVSRENTKKHRIFSKMPKWWATATQTKMAKRRRKTKTSKTHLAAYVEVSLSQIQCGNLTAETVHFWHIMTHSCFHIWQNNQQEAEQTPPCLLAARCFQK